MDWWPCQTGCGSVSPLTALKAPSLLPCYLPQPPKHLVSSFPNNSPPFYFNLSLQLQLHSILPKLLPAFSVHSCLSFLPSTNSHHCSLPQHIFFYFSFWLSHPFNAHPLLAHPLNDLSRLPYSNGAPSLFLHPIGLLLLLIRFLPTPIFAALLLGSFNSY